MIASLAILIFLDQITKTVFADRDFFFFGIHFHAMQNYALPFGLDFGSRLNFLVLFVAYAVLGVVISNQEVSNKKNWWGRALFVAGASGNLADRVLFGYVRDFVDLQLGFVFNLADVFIVIGLLLVLFSASGKGGGDGAGERVEKRSSLV